MNTYYNIYNKTRRTLVLTFAAIASVGADAQTLGEKCMPEGNVTLRNVKLEHSQSKMLASMDMVLNDLNVKSPSYVTYTPVLVSSTGRDSVELKQLVVTGRRQDIIFKREGMPLELEGSQVERRYNDKEQTVSYSDMTEYKEWMHKATLRLRKGDCGCGKKQEGAEGNVFSYNTEPWRDFKYPALPAEKGAKQYKLHGTAYINFIVDKWDVVASYMNNPRELKKITDTLDIMVADPNITVNQIKIHGYASPESPYLHNKMLATNRAQSLTDYVQGLYKLPSSVFAKAEATPENWGDLRDSIADGKYPIANRAKLLQTVDKVLGMDDSQKEKNTDNLEAQMKKAYGKDYDYILKNIYPHLRRSDYEITFTVKAFSAEEAAKMITKNPAVVSDREKMSVAIDALQRGDAKTAEYAIKNMDETPEIQNIKGAIEAVKGNYTKARQLFKTAQANGCVEAAGNLKAIGELE